MIRALVFDFDGLILDTETSEYETVREVYEALGFELPLEEWRQRIGTHSRHWLDELEELAGRLDGRDAILEQRRLRHRERILVERVLPGVERTIEAAVEAGLLLAVASSSSAEWVGGHLARLGLLDHFSELACRAGTVPAKPAPDLYAAVVGALGVAPREAIAFEDSPNGVAAARAADLWCVAVPNAMTRDMDFTAADLVVSSFEHIDLPDLLHTLPT